MLVSRDHRDVFVSHACAAVVMGNQALLVDPAYSGFGVRHKEFEFEDDLRATAIFLSSSKDLRRKKLALKLTPDWARPYFNLSTSLAGASRNSEAREYLERGLALAQDEHDWLPSYSEGIVEFYEGHAAQAIASLRRCLAINPNHAPAHFFIGEILLELNRLQEARSEFLQCLTNGVNIPARDVADIGKRIDYIDRILSSQTSSRESERNGNSTAEARP